MTTALDRAQSLARHEALCASVRYEDDREERRRRELAEMAAFVGRPRPRPVRRTPPPARPRSEGRWKLTHKRPGVAARFVWVPAARPALTASAGTASAPARRAAVPLRAAYWTRPGWNGPGMTYDLSGTASF